MPKRYWFVVGTFLLAMLLYVDRACISAAKSDVQSDLGLSDKQMGWVMSAFALGYALLQTPSGILADRFGPRRILTAVVAFWSLFTGLTAATVNYASLLVCRLLFGMGEAGAFPGCARAIFSWIPMSQRGLVQGINFSGSRIGGAAAIFGMPWLIGTVGWRQSFVILAGVGFAWAGFWYLWFRDDPAQHPRISKRELDLILQTRQQAEAEDAPRTRLPLRRLAGSVDVWLMCVQYLAQNVTVYFCLTWLLPDLEERFSLDIRKAGFYAMLPFLAGAVGNWVGGVLVDWIYRRGHWTLSRRLPAVVGYALAGAGFVAYGYSDRLGVAVACLCVAFFGADMTLSASWSLCVDIGRRHAGAVSGTMNMAGNLMSFATALAYPYLRAWTGRITPFFFIGAAFNVVAIVAWLFARPDRPLEEA